MLSMEYKDSTINPTFCADRSSGPRGDRCHPRNGSGRDYCRPMAAAQEPPGGGVYRQGENVFQQLHVERWATLIRLLSIQIVIRGVLSNEKQLQHAMTLLRGAHGTSALLVMSKSVSDLL
jgi:hypothetical protein